MDSPRISVPRILLTAKFPVADSTDSPSCYAHHTLLSLINICSFCVPVTNYAVRQFLAFFPLYTINVLHLKFPFGARSVRLAVHFFHKSRTKFFLAMNNVCLISGITLTPQVFLSPSPYGLANSRKGPSVSVGATSFNPIENSRRTSDVITSLY